MGVTDLLIKTGALLGSKYLETKYAPQPVTQFSYQQPIAAAPAFFGADTSVGLPFVDVVGTTGKEGLVYDPNANCGAGKWIKRRRRRRKVLVTNSEIAGLAKLKGVVGAGQAMREWIATHS